SAARHDSRGPRTVLREVWSVGLYVRRSSVAHFYRRLDHARLTRVEVPRPRVVEAAVAGQQGAGRKSSVAPLQMLIRQPDRFRFGRPEHEALAGDVDYEVRRDRCRTPGVAVASEALPEEAARHFTL